jgi:3-oxoacyl-[acyl-carrier protein] reductase
VFSLEGKAALITGAASGIGAATAKRFANAGADLVITWYPGDPHDIGPTVEAVEQAGRKAVVMEGDVAKTDDVDSWVAACIDAYGKIDAVVANAAIARDVPSPELDDERWTQLMEINLLGVFRCFRAALPRMIEQGSGRLMATSSIAGAVQGWGQHVHYTASKAGVQGMIRGLAVEVAPHGITVNGIAPGVIVTPQTLDEVNSLGPDGLEVFGPTVPVGRNGQPEEIAAVYHFLASDEASYLTGQVITVDGGVSLSLA